MNSQSLESPFELNLGQTLVHLDDLIFGEGYPTL